MVIPALEGTPQDTLALALARAVAVANETALAHGKDPAQCLISIVEEAPPPRRVWRIHYGPRDFVGCRGGDLIVFVNEEAGEVARVLHGQ